MLENDTQHVVFKRLCFEEATTTMPCSKM